MEHIVSKTLVLFDCGRFNYDMVFDTDSVQNFLAQEFGRRVRLNPRYSLRAFARALGLSSGALSEILRDRRPLSFKAATKIAKSLGLNSAETKKIYELVESDRRRSMTASAPAEPPTSLSQTRLDQDTFHLVSEWYHFAILNLLDCEGVRWNASRVAKRLGLSSAQAQVAMNLLLRLGLVREKDGKARSVPDVVLAPSDVPSAAIRSYHRQILEKAIQALELQSLNEREMTGVGFAVDPNRLPQIKREISHFQDQLVAKYSKGKRQEVYFLETALFRLTSGERIEDN